MVQWYRDVLSFRGLHASFTLDEVLLSSCGDDRQYYCISGRFCFSTLTPRGAMCWFWWHKSVQISSALPVIVDTCVVLWATPPPCVLLAGFMRPHMALMLAARLRMRSHGIHKCSSHPQKLKPIANIPPCLQCGCGRQFSIIQRQVDPHRWI